MDDLQWAGRGRRSYFGRGYSAAREFIPQLLDILRWSLIYVGVASYQSYGDMYRNATQAEKETSSSGKWYTKKPDKEKQSAKKLREWEREQKAREEA